MINRRSLSALLCLLTVSLSHAYNVDVTVSDQETVTLAPADVDSTKPGAQHRLFILATNNEPLNFDGAVSLQDGNEIKSLREYFLPEQIFNASEMAEIKMISILHERNPIPVPDPDGDIITAPSCKYAKWTESILRGGHPRTRTCERYTNCKVKCGLWLFIYIPE